MFFFSKKLPQENNNVHIREKPVDDDSATFESLSKLGKKALDEIFGTETVWFGRYVKSGTDCPSIGIIKTTSDSILIREEVKNFGTTIQKRIFIRDVGDLPMKATNYPIIPTTVRTNILLIIGLARGFEQKPDAGKVCYLIVIGILSEKV